MHPHPQSLCLSQLEWEGWNEDIKLMTHVEFNRNGITCVTQQTSPDAPPWPWPPSSLQAEEVSHWEPAEGARSATCCVSFQLQAERRGEGHQSDPRCGSWEQMYHQMLRHGKGAGAYLFLPRLRRAGWNSEKNETNG